MSRNELQLIGGRRWTGGPAVGAALLAAALLMCCGGGGWLLGPAIRASQDPAVARASQEAAAVYPGQARIDVYDGHGYLIYVPRDTSWPDVIECGYRGEPGTFVVQRGPRPFGAPSTRTGSDAEYGFFGAFQGDRDQRVSLSCSYEKFLVAPDRAPLWRFWGVVAGSVLCGLLALVAGWTIRHRRHRRQRSPGLPPATPARPPGFLPVDPVGHQPLSAAGASARSKVPSPMWYLAVVPLFMVCLLSGWATALAALSLSDSYEPARVGERRSGWVDDHYPEFIIGIDHDQLLYADLADPVPDRLDCGVYSEGRRLDDPMRADRPLGVPETITSGGRTYQFVAVYRPRPNFFDVSSVRCSGSSTLLVKPSNRPQLLFYGGAVTLVMAQLASAAVVIGVSARRRKGTRPHARDLPSGHDQAS